MRVPFNRLEKALQCPISGRKFPFKTLRQKRAAMFAQQEFTCNLIIELDGDGDGIRRPIQHYINQYNRRHGSRTASQTGSLAVPAA